VPAAVGVKLLPVAIGTTGNPTRSLSGGISRASFGADGTVAEWSTVGGPNASKPPVVLAGAAERPAVEAALRAAPGRAPGRDSAAPIAIIYEGYERKAELLRRIRSVTKPWMGDVISRLAVDPVAVAAAAASTQEPDTSIYREGFATILRNGAGVPVVLAAQGSDGRTDRLELWLLADAGSLLSAALIGAAARSMAVPTPPRELEPDVLPPDLLRRWERPAGTVGIPPADEASDGRWFWLIALLLLGMETLVRRRADALPTHSAGTIRFDRDAGISDDGGAGRAA
jgi:hypothetical protein